MIRLLTVLLFFSLFVGCLSGSCFESGDSTLLSYQIYKDGVHLGSIAWTFNSTVFPSLDGWGATRKAHRIEMHAVESGNVTHFTIISSVASGEDLSAFTPCAPEQCTQETWAEFSEPGTFATAFGLKWPGFNRIERGGILPATFEHEGREYRVELLEGEKVRLAPLRKADRLVYICNAADDEVIYDLHLRVIAECRHENGYRFILDTKARSSVVMPKAERDEGVPRHSSALRAVSFAQHLPPGSEDLNASGFSLKQAYQFAIENSEVLRSFLTKHPDSILSHAHEAGGGEGTAPGYRDVSLRWRLEFKSPSGQRFEVVVAQSKMALLGVNAVERYHLVKEAEMEAGRTFRSPERMAAVRVGAAWDHLQRAFSMSLEHEFAMYVHIAPSGSLSPMYVFFKEGSCEGTCARQGIIYDAGAGRLVAGPVPTRIFGH
ncbi:MAG TPA: hypothetical protein VM889_08440 [Candidatus Thermoplasmatota archaeon]|nr:hypothetical protein [Candidatus Thermoplasmatota archaeon]